MLDVERQQRAFEILESTWALDDESAWDGAVQACAGDRELLEEVRSLALADRHITSFPEPLDSELAADLKRCLASSLPQYSRIGEYRLLEHLGSGGIGDVYRAEQASVPMQRHVAIKILRKRIENSEAKRRILAEREILSGLDHPNIAQLFEVGTTEDDRPYFVMEWVNGLPIDQYCRENHLSLEARLGLFCDLCSAVHFSHQRFVVHRDLKPANILVAADGRLKLLDFSIAKALLPETLSAYVDTATGQQPMTLAFASPEQIRNEEITTATDVHGLGVVLYMLLTDRHPFDIVGTAVHEVAEAICQEPVPRPSQIREGAAGEPRSGSGVIGSAHDVSQLDAIVLGALNKEPSDRYASAEQLRLDIENYLSFRPISVSPPGPLREVTLAIRRHRGLTTSVFASLLLLAVFVTSLLYQVKKTAEEAERANRERIATERVADFLVGMFGVLDSSYGETATATAHQLLDTAFERAVEELKEEPESQSRVLSALGASYRDLGLVETSISVLTREVELRRQAFGAPSNELAKSINDLAYSFWRSRQVDEATERFGQALVIVQSTPEPDPAVEATSLNGLGLTSWYKGDHEDAESYFHKALRLRTEAHGLASHQVASSLNNIGIALRDQGRNDEAARYARRAVETRVELLGPSHPIVARSYFNLAAIYDSIDQCAEAVPLFHQAIRIWSEVFGEQHPKVAASWQRLASCYLGELDFESAEKALETSMGLHSESGREDTEKFGRDLMLKGQIYLAQERYSDAVQTQSKAVEVLEQHLGADHRVLAAAYESLGVGMRARGHGASADSYFAKAARIHIETFGRDHPSVVEFCATYEGACARVTEHREAPGSAAEVN